MQAWLLKDGTTLNRDKSKVIFLVRVGPGDLSADQRAELERTELIVAWKKDQEG